MHDTPPISAVCVTYGRPQLLEEAIYSFLQQDYPGEKELIVLNDLKEQQLSFDHPEVRVINVTERFASLGEKRNAAVELARHEIIFPWDDDDIYLPHRLSFSIRHLSPERSYFKPDKSFMYNNAALSGPMPGWFQSSSCYTRGLFNRIGGYRPLGKGEDVAFEEAVGNILGKDKDYPIQHPSEVFYLYRWFGTGSYHTSGKAYPSTDPAVVNARVDAYIRQQLDTGALPVGEVSLEPKWHGDYADMAAGYIRQLKRESA